MHWTSIKQMAHPQIEARGPALLPIMLVEDEATDVLLIRRAFEEAGVENAVLTMSDADKALAYLEGVGEYSDRIRHPLPVFILLDLKLPGMPGLQLLKWIRTRKELRLIPVIVLTASDNQADINFAYEAGANSYLRKPGERKDIGRLVHLLQQYWLEHNVAPKLVLRASPE
jgi:CheY-like chemotaxis protein